MKKSTILILLVVFFGSVLIVGVFGMQAVPFEQWIYVNEIRPTGVYTSSGAELEIKENEKGYYVVVPYEEGLTVLITTKVSPEDSTNRELKISIVNNPEDNPIAKVGEKGEIIFLRRSTVSVQFRAQDSATGPVMNFRIIPRKPTAADDEIED